MLLLLALARLRSGEGRLMGFSVADTRLRELLTDFGPPRKSVHPEYPFWRLQNDGLWEVADRGELLCRIDGRPRKGDVPAGVLRRADAHAGFSEPVDRFLRENGHLVDRLASEILEANFPASVHAEILDAVGLEWTTSRKPRRRDPEFRPTILRIYEHRCGVCGYDGMLGGRGLGIEAAHVKWHAAGGPDDPDNGIALCTFHHRAFDRGALGFDADRRLLVSQHVHGSSGVDELLLKFSGAPLHGPQPGAPRPRRSFLSWHLAEVFRAPARVA